LNNVRCEVCRHCRNEKKAYLRAKFEEHENESKIKNRESCKGINDFKKCYQLRNNTVVDAKDALVADS
jgi:hypothetical protein